MIPCYITSEMSDDLEEALQLGLEAGVDTVHLRKGLFGKEVQDLEADDLPRIQDTLGKFGAKTGVLMPPFAKCDLDDTEKFARHEDQFANTVSVARSLDTPYVRWFPFTGLKDADYSVDRINEYLSHIAERLQPSVGLAESEGIAMCFEVVNSTIARTALDTRKVIDKLASPAAKAIWEIDTGWRVGESPSEGYPHLKGLIRDIHIKPNDQGDMDPIGDTGETMTDTIQRLQEDGYDGMITIEHWKGQEGILKGLRLLIEAIDEATNRF